MKYIKKNFCQLCGDTEDLQIHHLNPRCLNGTENIENKITVCYYCHWYLHHNPKCNIKHNSLVKLGLQHAKAKGKQLGRPKLDVDTKKLFNLHNDGLSIRKIATALHISVGSVYNELHKIKYGTK